ncbi:MAG: nucleotide exchange factor GrpE [Candidatus Pacebacteria bacterium]|nr:nucleotide exchange factor GrpE [Candidatus Paceibacterota bacterium]
MTDELNKNKEIEEQVEELENSPQNKASDTSSNLDVDDIIFDEDAELGDNQVVKKLREKLKTAVDEKQAYLDGWQRDKAEFMNARKRDEEAKQDFLKFAKLNVIEDILPVLDSFDMAMANKASWDTISAEWRKGVEGIYNQLLGALTKQGVSAFGAKGDSFDPNLHQSVSMVPTDDKSQDHTVADVLQKGYMLSGKVVRAAMVQVYEA